MLTMSDQRPPSVPESGNGTRPSLPPPDPEVVERPRRRTFTAKYKLRILEEADACTEIGAVGALLRREGLYSSHLSSWRRQRKGGVLSALKPKKRGRKGKVQTPEAKRIAELESKLRVAEREKRKLEAKLRRADLLLEIQKKASELLEIPLDQPGSNGSGS